MNKTSFLCPVCQSPLFSIRGTQVNSDDGITLYCPATSCPSPEVSGHGKNEQAAYEIVCQKFSLDE